jgi:hypothetical protein
MKTQFNNKKLLINKLTIALIAIFLIAQPALSLQTTFDKTSGSGVFAKKIISDRDITNYLLSVGYVYVLNVAPIEGTNNWIANVRNIHGANVTVIVYTDGVSEVVGHEEIWIK